MNRTLFDEQPPPPLRTARTHCKRCGEDREISNFSVYRSQATGNQLRRKICNRCREIWRKWSALTPEKRADLLSKKQQSRQNPLHRAKWILHDSRRSDKKRGLDNDLDVTYIQSLIRKGCSYCGDTSKMTLDRIDNTRGHTKDNVMPACIRCNYLRGSMPYDAWMIIAPSVRLAFEQGAFGDWLPKRQ